MTEEQKKAIKDIRIKVVHDVLAENEYVELPSVYNAILTNGGIFQQCFDRAMQIYGEQCRKEAIKDKDFILSSIETALSVGEIHFEACALSKGAKKNLLEAKEKLTAQA
jgi:hypothetical protein